MPGARRKIFSGRIFKVYTEKKTLPDGRKTRIDGVDHPGASVIVPFKGRSIVFIRQYRPVIEKFIWELPAGTLEKGEKPLECAKREVKEETGFRVKKIKKIGKIYTTPGFCNEQISVYAATCSSLGGPQRDADEHIRVKLLTRKDVKKMFASGKITDSKTISALTLAGVL